MSRQQQFAYLAAVGQVTMEHWILADAVKASQALMDGDGGAAFEISGWVLDYTGVDIVSFI